MVLAVVLGAAATPTPAVARTPRLPFLVGAAQRSIAPAADGTYANAPVFLGGYGILGDTGLTHGRRATGVLGSGPRVRAFVVSDGQHALALADIEVQGWFAATRDGAYGLTDIRREVARRTGGALPASAVIVQSDHSHSGADAMGVWGGVPLAYRRFMAQQTVDAIVAAFDARRRARLVYGTAPGRDLLSNQFAYDAANRGVDDEVRVLQARDARGRPLATLLDFSAHATVLGPDNTKISGDWVQAASPLLAKRLGGRPVTIVGTLGRTQPADRGCPDKRATGDAKQLCAIDAYARRVVARAASALRHARPVRGTGVAARSYLLQDVATNPVIVGLDYAGALLSAPFNRSLAPPWMTAVALGTPTQSARIGRLLLSAGPGEMYPQIPLSVRALAHGWQGYLTAGLAGDQLGYLIAPYRAYPEPVRRTFFNERGDQVAPLDNDNYAFNVSPTLGQRVACSLLRGAGELDGRGSDVRDAESACAAFGDDALRPAGADVR